ncbi:hypothetical protein A5809_000851 [Enterococcus faecium]|nr:transposase [Enterococcus faecium]OTN91486.1 hypothetical protein A5809_000851 [Enterococcus faecium]
MLEQIKLLEFQVKIVEGEIHELISKQENFLTTITGIGDITAAVIMVVEAGDISRFDRLNKLLALLVWFRRFCSAICRFYGN